MIYHHLRDSVYIKHTESLSTIRPRASDEMLVVFWCVFGLLAYLFIFDA